MRRLRSSSIKSRGVAFLALLVCLFSVPAVGQPWDGNGVEGDPYLIYDACDMQAIGADSNYWDAHFKLMADIDLGGFTGTGFNMIGEGGNPFTGVFDGNGHTISNFTYNSSGTSFVGIFGLVYETGAEIKNLGLIDPNVDAGFGHYVGSLVGWIENGRVTNCRVEGGSVSGKRSGVGGLIGMIFSDVVVTRCYSMVRVNGHSYVGGLTGYNYDDGTIIDCHSVAVVSGQELVGGLVGYNYGQLYDCYSASDVSGNRGVGCLVGRSGGSWGIISNCAASGSVVGEEDFGGLVGINTGRSLITDCYSTSAVSGVGGGGMTVGGLVGLNHGVGWGDAPRISNSYSVGGISGALDEMGGLVGCNGAKGTVSNCYSSMRIEGYRGWVGGLVGVNEGTITDSYSTGSISGMEYIGGLVGWNSGEIVASYSERTVSGDAGVGGLAGYNYNGGIISGSFATGEVSGGSAVGGLVGENEWEISDCYATGKVSGDDSVGGLVGFNLNYDGIGISNCYSLGDVNGTRRDAGGFVGCNVLGVISNCYSAGNVNGTNGVGGFVGYQDNSCVYQRNFWDSDVNPDVNGIGNTTDPNVIGESTANMQTESTFTDSGWDFVGEVINGPNDVWTICEGEDYPRLAWEKYGGGNGTEANPYLIYTSCQMQAIGADSNDWDAHFKLMADIDLSGYTGTEFNIIGTAWNNAFTGVFDGNGHTISNFTYDSNGVSYIGLFGYVDDPNAEIKDLSLIDPNIDTGNGGNYIGSLVGFIYGRSVTGCYVEGGSVEGGNAVGGLIGSNDGTILGCRATTLVSGDHYIGGVVGVNYGAVSDCYAIASVFGQESSGGLVGMNKGDISRCYARGRVSGEMHSTGGLVGINVHSTIWNCYSTATVDGNERVGGLVGTNDGEVMIRNCYSIGSVLGTTDVGALVGYNDHGSIFYTKSFWDSNVNPDVNGIGNTTDPNVIGESTPNMQMESTFTDAGWDFVGEVINGPNDIWDICEGTNYPKFVWQIPAADFVCPDGVTLVDFSVLGLAWYSDPNQPNWNLICDISEPNDNFIDELDLKVFTENWLAGI